MQIFKYINQLTPDHTMLAFHSSNIVVETKKKENATPRHLKHLLSHANPLNGPQHNHFKVLALIAVPVIMSLLRF